MASCTLLAPLKLLVCYRYIPLPDAVLERGFICESASAVALVSDMR